ncbi:MAG: type I methionyl aminopeptidase [Candidatus Wildermuthbacteria bacterium]|nr:type I methionyl aminopeptidase [Candidatus Wildermuthbacteria bacterium]
MISLKSSQEIEVMRTGGEILSKILDALLTMVQPGMSTKSLDRAAEALILHSGAKPAFKGYDGFPASLCVCLNDEIVHAVPSEKRIIQEGDMVTLDIGLIWKGFYLDMARTVAAGKISPAHVRFINTTKKALDLGIQQAQPGNTVGNIGNTIQKFVEKQGYNVVRELCGHGIGRALHEDPMVLNYGKENSGAKLKKGMVICIEPMITAGDWRIKQSSDGFGYVTRDHSLSCHFEDTIAITNKGPEVLTRT